MEGWRGSNQKQENLISYKNDRTLNVGYYQQISGIIPRNVRYIFYSRYT